MKDDASTGKLTKGHNDDAIESCWKTTKDVLHRSGIELEEQNLMYNSEDTCLLYNVVFKFNILP